jgi:preprotein translocase subunit SecE
MAARAESHASAFDTVKLVVAIIFLVAGVVGYYYFTDLQLLYRILGVVGLSVLSLGVILTTAMGKSFLVFLRESRLEVRRVVWPTRQETMQATLVVVALVFLVGLILWFLDMALFWAISSLTGEGK